MTYNVFGGTLNLIQSALGNLCCRSLQAQIKRSYYSNLLKQQRAESHWHAAQTVTNNDKKYYVLYFYKINTLYCECVII